VRWLEKVHLPFDGACRDAFGVHWIPLPAEMTYWRGAGTCGTGLSYRDLEELLAERSVEVGHVTLYR